MEPKIKKPKVKVPTVKATVGKLKKTFGMNFVYVLVAVMFYMVSGYFFGNKQASLEGFIYYQLFYLFLGIVHCFAIYHLFSAVKAFTSRRVLIMTFIIVILFFFLVMIDEYTRLLPDVPTYYKWGVLAFLVPCLLMVAFEFLSHVPQKIYLQWFYPYGKEVPVIEVIEPIKINFYIAKQQGDEEYHEFSLNVPPQYSLGEFIHYFLHRYNYDKNPDSPIFVSPDNSNENLYGWIFRTKGFLSKYKILDPELSFLSQKVKENTSILVDRYVPTREEKEALREEMKISIENVKTTENEQ